MRQWAGVVSKTPDRGPLLGVVEAVEGFILDAGWGGYGFMGCPAGGKLMAELIISGEAPAEIRPYSLTRFATGDFISEPTIIGLAEDSAQRKAWE
jgi:sarcosine oxidase subunit beta